MNTDNQCPNTTIDSTPSGRLVTVHCDQPANTPHRCTFPTPTDPPTDPPTATAAATLTLRDGRRYRPHPTRPGWWQHQQRTGDDWLDLAPDWAMTVALTELAELRTIRDAARHHTH